MSRFLGTFTLFCLVTVGLYLANKDKIITAEQAKPLPSSASATSPQLDVDTSELSKGPTSANSVMSSNTANDNFELAMTMKLCATTPKDANGLTNWLDEAEELGEPRAHINEVLDNYDKCQRVSLPDFNYLPLLITAAQQGHQAALAQLWRLPDSLYLSTKGVDPNAREAVIDARSDFTRLKYTLAQTAAVTGDQVAIELLVKGYQNTDPETGSTNDIKALAYANFAVNNTNDNDFYRKMNWFKQKLESELSPEQRVQAQDLAEQLSQ